MHIQTRLSRTSFSVASALLFSLQWGCGDALEDDGSADDGSAEHPTERVTYATVDGGELEVSTYTDGQVLLGVVLPAQSLEVLHDFASGESDLNALYVGLTADTNVPDAIQRMNALLQEPPDTDALEDDALEDDLTDEINPTLADARGLRGIDGKWTWTGNLSAQAFRDYVRGTRSTGSLSIVTNKNTDDWRFSGAFKWMEAFTYCYRGTVLQQLDRERWGSYRKVYDREVDAGEMSYYLWNSVGHDRLKCRVRYVDQYRDGFHHACRVD